MSNNIFCASLGARLQSQANAKVEQGHLSGSVFEIASADFQTPSNKTVVFKGIPYAKAPIGDLRFEVGCWRVTLGSQGSLNEPVFNPSEARGRRAMDRRQAGH